MRPTIRTIRPSRWFPLACAWLAITAASPALAVDEAVRTKSDPLLEKIGDADLELACSKARKRYSGSWEQIDERGKLIRYRMLAMLAQAQAPASLQIVPIVESAYNPYVISHSGAIGLWQLMPGTARRMGIIPNSKQDGRRHIDQATDAAVRYLQLLHDRYDSWPLALAAYNLGPGALSRRLRTTPWNPGDPISQLPAPSVTREYVYQIIGLIALVDAGELRLSEPLKTRSLELAPPVDLNRLAAASHLDRHQLFRLNPGLNQSQYLTHPVVIHVPEDHFEEVMQHRDEARPEFVQIVVREGDTLWDLCHRHHTTIAMVKQLNGKLGRVLHIGQRLKFPAGNYTSAAANANPLILSNHRVRYRVRNGDSLWGIARRFGTTVTDIARANGLSRKAVIRAGDTLWVKASSQPG